MNRLRNFITGSADDEDYGYGGGGDDYPQQRNDRQNNQSSNSKYGYNNNSRPPKPKQSSSRYNNNDDLYLSDDDDWGMSAFSATQNSLQRGDEEDDDPYNDDYGERRGSSSAFWDQSALDDADGAGVISMEMSTPSNASRKSSRGAMQEWEREAIMRDSLSDAFEIGNDDYYHSDQRRAAGKTSPKATSKNNAYAEVQEDIRSLEEGDDDCTASSTSSNQEEVVNAYRDYLKSIRDGGFESYLDKEDVPGGGRTDDQYNEAHDLDNTQGGNDHGEDEALERVLDIEEERASGSLYGDLYGVHDMRSATSPYSAWRAKAKALLQQEQERHEAASPSRQILDRFRRKRLNNSMGVGASSSSQEYAESEKRHTYRPEIFQHPQCRMGCIGVCLILALSAGLSYYGGKNNDSDDNDGEMIFPDLAIPPKSNEVTTSASSNEKTQNNSQNAGPSDAILNALGTFDPRWYDRMSGWEVRERVLLFMNMSCCVWEVIEVVWDGQSLHYLMTFDFALFGSTYF